MNKKRSAFTVRGHEFQWQKRRTLKLCADCEFHLSGPFAECCEVSTSSFDCKGEEYGAWQENIMGE